MIKYFIYRYFTIPYLFRLQRKLVLVLLCLVYASLCSCSVTLKGTKTIFPDSFGFKIAQNGVERYEALYRTHCYAIAHGYIVDYKGIKRIDLEIPKDAKSIPLGKENDFKNVVFHVVNKQKDIFLFEMKDTVSPIQINATELDSQYYLSPKLKKGNYILSIEDENPWIEKRRGFNYGVKRKDVIYIEDGVGSNRPCATYLTKSSSPSFSYRKVTSAKKIFSNITLVRDVQSTKKTQLVHIEYQNNVSLEGVKVYTPESKLYGDEAISIYNCTNITLKKITINGTYSLLDRFGYGIGMNNVWNVICEDIDSKTNWGVWCCNNAHKIELHNCNINRFDIHCYGRDVTCYNCTFTDMGGTYSSVYGDIKYENCTFNNAIPYVNRPDFNAYVEFNLYLKNCTFNSSANRFCFIDMRRMDNDINSREELKEKRLPNVYIEDMEVNISSGVEKVFVYYFDNSVSYKPAIGYLSKIKIDGLKCNNAEKPVVFALSSQRLKLNRALNCEIKRMDLGAEKDESKTGRFISNIITKQGDRIILK